MNILTRKNLFQSTLPARGATDPANEAIAERRISIHAPRTGSDQGRRGAREGLQISIHAPRTGSDPPYNARRRGNFYFNPRSPHGERLFGVGGHFGLPPISIHAPRTGSDLAIGRPLPKSHAFQSTLPARGATSQGVGVAQNAAFQSTLPARGATVRAGFHVQQQHISIHAPRTGSD